MIPDRFKSTIRLFFLFQHKEIIYYTMESSLALEGFPVTCYSIATSSRDKIVKFLNNLKNS